MSALATRGRPGRAFRLVAFVLATLAAGRAHADRQELYTVIAYDPGGSRFRLPVKGSSSDVTKFTNGLDAAAYYGLSNRLHIGARIRASRTSNVQFSGTSLRMKDGSLSQGDVFMDHWALGLGTLVVYRIDTRSALAPLLEMEGGVMTHRYGRIVHIPAGVSYSVPQGDVSSTAAYGSAAVMLEYRFRNRWVAATGISAQREASGFVPWTVSVPIRLGHIW